MGRDEKRTPLKTPAWEAIVVVGNDHDDHNDDFKETIGLMIRTTSPHVHHAF